jgi:hypothetical protein
VIGPLFLQAAHVWCCRLHVYGKEYAKWYISLRRRAGLRIAFSLDVFYALVLITPESIMPFCLCDAGELDQGHCAVCQREPLPSHVLRRM